MSGTARAQVSRKASASPEEIRMQRLSPAACGRLRRRFLRVVAAAPLVDRTGGRSAAGLPVGLAAGGAAAGRAAAGARRRVVRRVTALGRVAAPEQGPGRRAARGDRGGPGHRDESGGARRLRARAIGLAMDEVRRLVPDAGSYLSESDFFLPHWQRAFWGSNHERLRAVKARYDPQGLFVVHHGVGSESWSADGFTRR